MSEPVHDPSQVAQWLEQHELSAMVVASPEQVRYFTGYRHWLSGVMHESMMVPGGSDDFAPTLAVVGPTGRAILVTELVMSAHASTLPDEDVLFYGDPQVTQGEMSRSLTDEESRVSRWWQRQPRSSDVAQVVWQALEMLGVNPQATQRIGWERQALSQTLQKQLQQPSEAMRWLDASKALRVMQQIKTDAELALLRRAAEVSEQAMRQTLSESRVGDTFAAITQRFTNLVTAQGCVMDHVAYAPRGLGLAMSPAGQLRDDDVMFMDFGCILDGYFSDTGVTLAGSPLVGQDQAMYKILVEAMTAGSQCLQPGVIASEAQRAMDAVLSAAGVVCFAHGHGLGSQPREDPLIMSASDQRLTDEVIDTAADQTLEPNMVLNLEIPVMMPGHGSLHVEKTFVVTPEGAKPLIEQPRDDAWIVAG